MSKLKKVSKPSEQELEDTSVVNENDEGSKFSSKKRKLVPIDDNFLKYVTEEAFDQGGEMLVALKNALFGESSTQKWLDTFKKIQTSLDKFDIGERLKLMYYIDAPDFLMYFKMTDKAEDWIKGLRDKESMRLISLMATEFNYFHKSDPGSTLKEFSRFKGKSESDIENFFAQYHQKDINENIDEENEKEPEE